MHEIVVAKLQSSGQMDLARRYTATFKRFLETLNAFQHAVILGGNSEGSQAASEDSEDELEKVQATRARAATERWCVMGYDLYRINDPHEAVRRAHMKRFFDKTSDPVAVISGMYVVAQLDGGYFRASHGVVTAIRNELEQQGLAELAGYFVSNTGFVPTDVIRRALERLQPVPTMPADTSNPLDARLDSVIPKSVSGGDALMDGPPGAWHTKWDQFVNLLRAAVDHGGIRVT